VTRLRQSHTSTNRTSTTGALPPLWAGGGKGGSVGCEKRRKVRPIVEKKGRESSGWGDFRLSIGKGGKRGGRKRSGGLREELVSLHNKNTLRAPVDGNKKKKKLEGPTNCSRRRAIRPHQKKGGSYRDSQGLGISGVSVSNTACRRERGGPVKKSSSRPP